MDQTPLLMFIAKRLKKTLQHVDTTTQVILIIVYANRYKKKKKTPPLKNQKQKTYMIFQKNGLLNKQKYVDESHALSP